MRVVYRMRGLLGDATEEFVETLDKKKEEDVDNEQVYRMAGVMCHCGGLEVRKYESIAFSFLIFCTFMLIVSSNSCAFTITIKLSQIFLFHSNFFSSEKY